MQQARLFQVKDAFVQFAATLSILKKDFPF
jgi:hypothetical protein